MLVTRVQHGSSMDPFPDLFQTNNLSHRVTTASTLHPLLSSPPSRLLPFFDSPTSSFPYFLTPFFRPSFFIAHTVLSETRSEKFYGSAALER